MIKEFWTLIVPPDNPPKLEDDYDLTEEDKKEIEKYKSEDITVPLIIVMFIFCILVCCITDGFSTR